VIHGDDELRERLAAGCDIVAGSQMLVARADSGSAPIRSG
jgi:hypothetical protein